MIFDTHAHYDDKQFNDDRDFVLNDLKNHNISYVLNAGCDIKTSKNSIKLADTYDFIYASVGFHPHSAKEFNESHILELENLASHKKVLAIGEIGLDYYYDNSPRDIQKQVFKTQLDIANKLNMPVVIHDRDAHKDCLDIICEKKPEKLVYHCFSGSKEYADILVSKGYMMSFGGVLTFKNAKTAIEVIESVPIEHIMLETDCPYLSPVPHRGKRNDSRYLNLVVEKIAEIKNINYNDVCNITTKNAKEFFKIL